MYINNLRHITLHKYVWVYIDSVPVSSQVMLSMTLSPSFPISGIELMLSTNILFEQCALMHMFFENDRGVRFLEHVH